MDVREAWISFGTKRGSLEPLPGSSLYALVGKVPKFERQTTATSRATAWSRPPSTGSRTAVEVGARSGGSLLAASSRGNPLFIRDPNALAGDNGTDCRPNPDPHLKWGFPILYDAEVEELAADELESARARHRLLSADSAAGSTCSPATRGPLAEGAKSGTFYDGDLDILTVPATSRCRFPGTSGRSTGSTSTRAWAASPLFAQLVKEEAAGLPRLGIEVEAGYRMALGDLADPGDLFPAIQPARALEPGSRTTSPPRAASSRRASPGTGTSSTSGCA